MNFYMKHDFLIVNADTDSIAFCKNDQSKISPEERKALILEINSVFDKNMIWADDGLYPSLICLKAKNYIMKDEKGKVKYKGSSLKSATLEPALKDFLKEIIDCMLNEKTNYVEVYNKYVKMIHNITDIKSWCSKRTISNKTLTNTRENEAKVRRCIEGSDYGEGDRIYVYFKEGKELGLSERFNNDHDKIALLKKLFKATKRFETVLDSSIFLDYSLKKKNQKELQELLNA